MFVTSQLTKVLDFYQNFLCYFHLRCVIKSPSVIRCDKLGNYKSSESNSIPHISQARGLGNTHKRYVQNLR
jgi:hypothetical protein